MNFWYVFAALTLFAALAFLAIFLRRRRAARRIEIRDTNPDNLAERIAPFIGHPELVHHMSPERLLQALGYRPGLRQMRAAICAIVTISARNTRLGTDEAPLWEKLFTAARWSCVVGICAAVELWLRQYIPALTIPFTEALARHYVDMVELMDTINTMHEYIG